MNILAIVIAVILFVLGIAGTVLPILPGVILVYAGMIVYGILTGFESLELDFFVLQGAATALLLGIDFVAASLGARKFKASKRAAIGAFAGTILGLITLGPIGILIGPFVGVVIIELFDGKNTQQALHSGIGTIIGNISGTLIKLVGEIAMIIYFFIQI
jgi:hypothetical protein